MLTFLSFDWLQKEKHSKVQGLLNAWLQKQKQCMQTWKAGAVSMKIQRGNLGHLTELYVLIVDSLTSVVILQFGEARLVGGWKNTANAFHFDILVQNRMRNFSAISLATPWSFFFFTTPNLQLQFDICLLFSRLQYLVLTRLALWLTFISKD